MTLDDAIDLIQSKYDDCKKRRDKSRDCGDFSYAYSEMIKMSDFYYFLDILKEIKDGMDK